MIVKLYRQPRIMLVRYFRPIIVHLICHLPLSLSQKLLCSVYSGQMKDFTRG